MRSVLLFLVGWLLFTSGPIPAAERSAGPWNLEQLSTPPTVEWITQEGTLRSLYYSGEPYRGAATRVFAYYAVPEHIDGKLPAMVLVHGGGGKAFAQWAKLWADRGYVALAMDLGGKGPDGQRLPDGGPDQSDQEKFLDPTEGTRAAWTYHAVINVVRGVSLLRAQEEVDPEAIGITGISWGGYLTCIVSGIDNRLKVSVPVYGCGFLHEDSMWLPRFADMSVVRKDLWVELFDPSRYLPQVSMPILFVNGTNDRAYPLGSYRKSYRLVNEKLRYVSVQVGMSHGHMEGWTPPQIGLFVDAVLKGGAPFLRISSSERTSNTVRTSFTSPLPVKDVALHWTSDTGSWQKRQWTSRSVTWDDGQAVVELPETRPLTYFLTVTDERNAIVSTEHEELP